MNLFIAIVVIAVAFVVYSTSKIWKAFSVLHIDFLDYFRAGKDGQKNLLYEKYYQEFDLVKRKLVAVLTEQQQATDKDDGDTFLLGRAIELLEADGTNFKIKGSSVLLRNKEEFNSGELFEKIEIDTIPEQIRDRIKRLLSVRFIATGGE